MDCPKCGEELAGIPFSSDPEGLMADKFCGCCNTRYGVAGSGLYIVSEPFDTAAIAHENAELKITIRTMMQLQKEDS